MIGIITFLLAYIVSAVLAGYFRAWVAKKCGDSTAEDAGFLSFSPFAHIDLIGLLVLIFFYFGWGRYVPVNPFNIEGPWRGLKLIAAFYSDLLVHLVLAVISLTILLALFDINILPIARYMILYNDISNLYVAHAYPTYGSSLIAIAFILIAMVYLNLILCVLGLIVNSVSLILLLLAEHYPEYAHYHYYMIIFLPIILIWLFAGPLRAFWLNVILFGGYGLAHLFGFV